MISVRGARADVSIEGENRTARDTRDDIALGNTVNCVIEAQADGVVRRAGDGHRVRRRRGGLALSNWRHAKDNGTSTGLHEVDRTRSVINEVELDGHRTRRALIEVKRSSGGSSGR